MLSGTKLDLSYQMYAADACGDIEAQREKILKWLVVTDPSPGHARTLSLHERHTSAWLTRDTACKDWIGGSGCFLWLYGIPGSGKTILS